MILSNILLVLFSISYWKFSIADKQINKMELQLFSELLSNYNKFVRPVQNASHILVVKFGSSLIQIIDVDEKNQVFTTNLWLELRWTDFKLVWNPADYGGVERIHIPVTLLWTPDIVLYNNAAGEPQITIENVADVYFDGTVSWKPPAIYKSFCQIDVTWFPYDQQMCSIVLMAWSHPGSLVDLRQLPESEVKYDGCSNGFPKYSIEQGMDLSYFYQSAEWDLLKLTSNRHEIMYESCCGPDLYVDITYEFHLRRKTLFYTVNLIIPCCLISFLTTFVFYLSDHKITFAISLFVTVTVFILVLIDIIPPTSTVICMFGQYLLITMVLVTLSIMISVVTVNFHFRRGSTHSMPHWFRIVFLHILPKLLLMYRPTTTEEVDEGEETAFRTPRSYSDSSEQGHQKEITNDTEKQQFYHKQFFRRFLRNVRYIAEHFMRLEDDDKEADDWVYVGNVIDRLFLYLYTICNIVIVSVMMQAPSLYDNRVPLSAPSTSAPLGQDSLGPESKLFTYGKSNYDNPSTNWSTLKFPQKSRKFMPHFSIDLH